MSQLGMCVTKGLKEFISYDYYYLLIRNKKYLHNIENTVAILSNKYNICNNNNY